MSPRDRGSSTHQRTLMLWRPRAVLFLIVVLVGTGIAASAGAAAFHLLGYQIAITRPTHEITRAQGIPSTPGTEDQLLRDAFTAPLPDDRPLQLPPVRSIPELAAAVRQLSMPYLNFYAAGADLVVGSAASPRTDVVEVSYSVHDWRSSAFAYAKHPSDLASCAILVIPGSGTNQSSVIAAATNPQNTLNLLGAVCDAYVQIKPNEDYRAINDGFRKLGTDYVYGHLVNHGASYSATYLTEAIALVRYLRARYAATGIVGLSQGGFAAFLVALETRPDLVVAASGVSMIQAEVYQGNEHQIAIPGLLEYFSADRISALTATGRTRFFLSYGRAEQGLYRVEAESGRTCDFLRRSLGARLICHVHDGGHIIPQPAVIDFVKASISDALGASR